MLKEMTKHEDKEHGKTPKHEAPLSINHKEQNRDHRLRTVNSITEGGGGVGGGLKYF